MARAPVEGKSWAEHVHPDDIGWLIEAIEAAMARKDERFTAEFRIIRADNGEVRWLACNTRMEYDENGTLARTIGAHLDITERRQAEEALRQSEERLRLVHEATGLGDFEAGSDGIARVSERFVAQAGLPPGTRELPLSDWLRVVRRELVMGLMLGSILALIGFVVALVMTPSIQGAAVLGITLLIVVICGAVTGSMLPLLFHRLGLDPAMMSNPFVACLSDLMSVLIYMQIALWLLPEASLSGATP